MIAPKPIHSPPAASPAHPVTADTAAPVQGSHTPPSATQTSGEQTAALAEGESYSAGPAAPAHGSEANVVHFVGPGEEPQPSAPTGETAPSAETPPTPPASQEMELQDWDSNHSSETGGLRQQRQDENNTSAWNDPGVQALLNYVRDVEDQTIQHMLDMIQQSLDRAAAQRKIDAEQYYNKELPQKQAKEAQARQQDALEEAGQRQAVAQNRDQFARLTQALQQAVNQYPEQRANPAVQQVLSEIASLSQER
ncbi:MAG: hypothetical protein ACO1RX_16830 [Candidatus Sericytochromatia bacterium]